MDTALLGLVWDHLGAENRWAASLGQIRHRLLMVTMRDWGGTQDAASASVGIIGKQEGWDGNGHP